MLLSEVIDDPLFFFGSRFFCHDGLLREGCEIVDRKRRAMRQFGSRFADKGECACGTFAFLNQTPLLKREDWVQCILAVEKFAYLRERQTVAF